MSGNINSKYILPLTPIYNLPKKEKKICSLPRIYGSSSAPSILPSKLNRNLEELNFCMFEECQTTKLKGLALTKTRLIKHYLDFHPQLGMVKKDKERGFLQFDGVQWVEASNCKASTLSELIKLVEESKKTSLVAVGKIKTPSKLKQNRFVEYQPPQNL